MCLDITRNFKKNNKYFIESNGKYMKLYKIFIVSKKRSGEKVLRSIFQKTLYKPLVNVSNRGKHKEVVSSYERTILAIDHGIHVFLEQEDAKRFGLEKNEVIVPVYCKAKNLVAVGKFNDIPSAVFTEVTIQKRDYERALKKGKKE